MAVALLAYGCWWLGEWQFHRLEDRQHRNAVVERNLAADPVPVEEVLAPGRPVGDQDAGGYVQVWVLEGAPLNTTNWVDLSRGFTAVSGGKLYQQPLGNFGVGKYSLRLTAHDGAGSAQDLGTLEVFADKTWQVDPPVNHAPTATLTRPPAGVPQGGAVTFVEVTD